MVPWTQLREPPLWGKCLTDLTSEFTHFILVIRLSKVKQPALPFCAFDDVLRLLWSQGFLAAEFLQLQSCAEHFETFLFSQQLLQSLCIITWHMSQAGTRFAGVVLFLFLVSGEVQHIVHLIRWNLKAVLCQLGQDLTAVPVKGIIARICRS